ncbi:hypothetical protein [Streptomyces virginiae]
MSAAKKGDEPMPSDKGQEEPEGAIADVAVGKGAFMDNYGDIGSEDYPFGSDADDSDSDDEPPSA